MAEKKTSVYVTKLYSESQISDEDLQAIYEAVRYHGFDRDEVLVELEQKVPDTRVAMSIVLTCALNGPQRASTTTLPNGKKIIEYGIPASGMQKKRGISCQRITAATADLAAFLLKRLNVPKRLNLDCPAWLQFPSAGSIIMTDELRRQQLDFSQRFSTVIGGKFNESIYMQMMSNAYLNENLKTSLFGDLKLEQIVINPPIPPPAASGVIATNPPSGSVSKHPPAISSTTSASSASSSVPKRNQ